MVDRPSNAPGSSALEPLSLTAFAASLYHAQRADNSFKFLKNFSEEDLANFLQGVLRQAGGAIDSSHTQGPALFVDQAQDSAHTPTPLPTPVRPDFLAFPLPPLHPAL